MEEHHLLLTSETYELKHFFHLFQQSHLSANLSHFFNAKPSR
jgi:hypothetical protein